MIGNELYIIDNLTVDICVLTQLGYHRSITISGPEIDIPLTAFSFYLVFTDQEVL